jgi:hypothetical protein
VIREVTENEFVYVRKKGQTDIDIRQFMESNAKICEAVDDTVSPTTLYYRYFQAVKRLGCHINVTRRGNRVFMIKKEDN